MVETYVDEFTFTVRVEWPEADVDVALSEAPSMFQPVRQVKDATTPRGDSVERFLIAVADDQVLHAAGLRPTTWHDLMMGCCSMTFAVDGDDAVARMPALISLAKRRMNLHRAQRVRYYKPGRRVGHACHVGWFR